MSPYRIAPAAPTPPPKRSAVVRLWHVGMRKPLLTFALYIASLLCLAFVIAIPATRSMGYLGAPVGLASSCLAILLRGYLRLRRVRKALAPCPTHRALGKHGRCGYYACCYACFRKDYDDVAALGDALQRSNDLQREAVARLTRYQATTETRERARYASGAAAAVAEARDRRKRIR